MTIAIGRSYARLHPHASQRAVDQAAVSFAAAGEEGWAVAAAWVAESVLELGDAGALTEPDPRGKIPAPCRCKVFAT